MKREGPVSARGPLNSSQGSPTEAPAIWEMMVQQKEEAEKRDTGGGHQVVTEAEAGGMQSQVKTGHELWP